MSTEQYLFYFDQYPHSISFPDYSYEVEEGTSLICKKCGAERVWQSAFDSHVVAIQFHLDLAFIAFDSGEMSAISLASGKRTRLSEFVGCLAVFEIKGRGSVTRFEWIENFSPRLTPPSLLFYAPNEKAI